MKKRVKVKVKRNIIVPVILCMVMTALLFYFVYALNTCSSYFDKQVKEIALARSSENVNAIKKNVGEYQKTVQQIASEMTSVAGFTGMNTAGESYADKYNMSCLQFLKGETALYRFGKGVGSSSSNQFKALVAGKRLGLSDIFTDMALGFQVAAVYCPVNNNPEIDGIIAYFPVTSLVSSDAKDDKLLKYYACSTLGGTILDSFSAENFVTDVSHNTYTYLEHINDTKSKLTELESNTKNRLNASYEVRIGGTDCIISCLAVNNFATDCFTVSIYEKSELLQSEYSLYDRLIGSAIGIILISMIVMLAYLILKRKVAKQRSVYDEIDPVLKCNTFQKFLRMADEILSINRHSNYAVVYFDLNRYSFVREHFDSEMQEDVLRYVATVIKKLAAENETYGHVANDCFVALLHFSSLEELYNRIKVIDALIGNFEPTKALNFTLTVSAGIYIKDSSQNYSAQEMVDRAIIAVKINKRNPEEPFSVYDATIRSTYMKENEIESKMEYALKHDLFHIFFQPKYSISDDVIAGAEALVRWYDEEKKDYTAPDEFIPLFEVNGFVSKLDRYVFKKVCEFLSECTRRGDKITPISVNVSRVTAIKPDFLSYYLSMKQKYGIADGFLMLEFTESFAFESYDTLHNIVSTLRKNGLKCSIDDFGSGYSSFSILKELPMDELKMDRLFLHAGTDFQKDDILLKTIISLGNEFNMQVTQEGVENKEQLEKLREYNCSVIQGFYYSKPLMMSDFIDFVNGDTSLNTVVSNHMLKRKKTTANV